MKQLSFYRVLKFFLLLWLISEFFILAGCTMERNGSCSYVQKHFIGYGGQWRKTKVVSR